MDSPIILYEMFQHAIEQGQKEVECMICQGCQHGLLKMDLKADISAIQLVGPQTSREEFKALYYEVCKLQGLPGSPMGARMDRGTHCRGGVLPRRLPGAEGGEPPQMMKEPNLTDVQPPRNKMLRRGRRDTSAERGLTEVREAHWRAWLPWPPWRKR